MKYIWIYAVGLIIVSILWIKMSVDEARLKVETSAKEIEND